MFTVLNEFLIRFIRYAFYLAIIGELLGTTNFYQDRARESLQNGLISLREINNQLFLNDITEGGTKKQR